jgi:hypothetical protein
MLLWEMAEYGGEPFPPFCGRQEFMHAQVCIRMLANFPAFCKLRCHSQKYLVRAQTLGIYYCKSKAVCALVMRKVGVQLFNSSPFPIRLFDKIGSEIPIVPYSHLQHTMRSEWPDLGDFGGPGMPICSSAPVLARHLSVGVCQG